MCVGKDCVRLIVCSNIHLPSEKRIFPVEHKLNMILIDLAHTEQMYSVQIIGQKVAFSKQTRNSFKLPGFSNDTESGRLSV